jgi:hypothetical protein
MPKYVKKHYDVLSGEVDMEPKHSYSATMSYHDRMAEHNRGSSVICLPDQGTSMPVMPVPMLKYRMINACKDAGINVGVKVIRVVHMNKNFIENPRFIGVVWRFTFDLFPGMASYCPIVVRFSQGDGFQDFAFKQEELETIDKAKELLHLNDIAATQRPGSVGEEIIKDIMRERHGVIPFRHPQYSGD